MNDFKFGRSSYIPKKHKQRPVYSQNCNYVRIQVANRVHLNSMNGTYIVSYYSEHYAGITCHSWQVQYESGLRKKSHILVHRSNIKCLHGNEVTNRT